MNSLGSGNKAEILVSLAIHPRPKVQLSAGTCNHHLEGNKR